MRAFWQALGGILETLVRCFGIIVGSEQHLRSDLLKFCKTLKNNIKYYKNKSGAAYNFDGKNRLEGELGAMLASN